MRRRLITRSSSRRRTPAKGDRCLRAAGEADFESASLFDGRWYSSFGRFWVDSTGGGSCWPRRSRWFLGPGVRSGTLLLACLPHDTEKPLSGTHSQLTITVDAQVIKELERLRELLAHHRPAPRTYGELLAFMTRQTLDRMDPERKQARKSSSPQTRDRVQTQDRTRSSVRASHASKDQGATPPAEKPSVRSTEGTATTQVLGPRANRSQRPSGPELRRPIPADLQRAVRERDQHHCTWKHPGGSRCQSRFGIEIDHEMPLAMGGATEMSVFLTAKKCHPDKPLAIHYARSGDIPIYFRQLP